MVLACAVTVAAVVVAWSISNADVEEEDDLLLKRLEAAITTCESKMKSASSEDDLKALSVDVDYIYEKLDSVSCIHPTKDQKRKEKRKMLVKRVTSIASVIDSKK